MPVGSSKCLADAGVAEKDIAASMHHASRATTARYLHAGRKAVVTAIAAAPDLDYDSAQLATGTVGPEPASTEVHPVAHRLRNGMDFSGLRWIKRRRQHGSGNRGKRANHRDL